MLSTRTNHSEEKPAGEKTEHTPTGTERARQEKTSTSPLKSHTKESLEEARNDRKEIPVDAQSIKGTETSPSATPEGREDRRPTVPASESAAAAEDRSHQPEGQRDSGHPQKWAGPR